jgi:hypothetical protein
VHTTVLCSGNHHDTFAGVGLTLELFLALFRDFSGFSRDEQAEVRVYCGMAAWEPG